MQWLAIVGIAGLEELDIGETLASSEEAETLPFVEIDPQPFR